MKKSEAIEIYFRVSRTPRLTLEKLLKWDEKLSLEENARNVGLTTGAARTFQIRFGLAFKRIINSGRKIPSTRSDAYAVLRKDDWTFKEIADLFGVSKQAVEEALRRRDR
jgi:hypothetical protein